ncbi:MAG: lysophospholipid acyltransferase family protein [Candidatus Omnitrophota bacterium]
MIYTLSRIIFTIILKVLTRLEIYGIENIPMSGPFILASNHASNADPAVLGVLSPKTHIIFMAKRELFDIPVFGAWFRAMDCVPIERYSARFGPLKKSVRKLQEGKALGIFPEGTRSTDGKFKKAQPGIGFIAHMSGAPIIPVYISGTDRVLPRGRKFIRLSKVKAKVGHAVDISESAKMRDKRKRYQSIGEDVMRSILQLKMG